MTAPLLTSCFMLLLDPFLPRIVELATSSSDRQTKVAACELLHSMVLYMLGRSVQQPDAKDKFPMGPLYQKIFPSLLRLACDVELVARQLFEPLVMQLIHWLTNNKKFESQETAALLDAIMVSNTKMAIPVIQLYIKKNSTNLLISFLFILRYRWTWIWQTQWDQENWSVVCKIRRIYMTNTWYASDWGQAYRPSYAKIHRTVVRHILVHLYFKYCSPILVNWSCEWLEGEI